MKIELLVDGKRVYGYAQSSPGEPPKPRFGVGDLVRYIGPEAGGLRTGAYGRVVCFTATDEAGIEFVRPFKAGHDLRGEAVYGHGRWFYEPGARAPQLHENMANLELVESASE